MEHDYNGPERRQESRFTSQELADLKEQLLESIYADIGRSITKKLIWVVGTLGFALVVGWNGKETLREWLK